LSETQINEILVSIHTQLTNIEKQYTKAGIFLTQDCFIVDFDLSKLTGKVFVGNFDSISIIGVREKDIYNLELLEENKINNDRPNNRLKLKTTLTEFNMECTNTYFNWLKIVLHEGFEKNSKK
jgi:hypothetical protein